MYESPPRCAVCGQISGAFLEPCEACRSKMAFAGSETCSMCSLDLAGADDPCPDCRDASSNLESLVCLGPWTGPLREWISQLKYGGDTRLSRWPAERLAEICHSRWKDVPVVPVPPRSASIRKKGYDTVTLIAQRMSAFGVEVLPLLRRIGNRTQKGLNREERMSGANLRFALRRTGSIPKVAILLDDVATTGATLQVCASVLKENGSERVFALAICRD